ncbi:MAG TPA: cupin domain-containing protein [Actinomycetota bacterium]|nr:cupin domain-containing protein [Actinomycetota bacterium]
MAIVGPAELRPMIEDEDDYRPRSRWSLVTDPGGPAGAVQDLCLLVQEVGVGDRIPLHRHRTDEIILVLEGRAEVTLGEERLEMTDGMTLFVPKGAIHGIRNMGDIDLRIREVFPSIVIDIEMLDRNPAPGTEEKAPAHMIYDAVTGESWAEPDEFEPPPAPPE